MPGPTAPAVFDAHMMGIALRMAERGLGRTAPNPSVGAVIADEATGELIARGWTAPGGRPHAETEAIVRAGARARGATMYVTLEPCSHHGATPPCADAIITAGCKRVVCAIEDPDPRVAGRGLSALRAAGIAVERGLMAEAAHWTAAGHILRVTERRPFVVAKLALGFDGSVPRGSQGSPVWATSAAARAQGHLLRARSDAILVGHQTVIDDDPLLTCRLPGLEDRSPVRIVLARRLEGLHRSRLALTAHERGGLWVFCGQEGDARLLEAGGARVFRVPQIGGELWLPSVMETLVAEGLNRLLIEGGPATWRAFSTAGLIDEAVLFHARQRGAALSETHAASALQRYVATSNLRLFDHRTVGSDDMMVFRRHWRSLGSPAARATTA